MDSNVKVSRFQVFLGVIAGIALVVSGMVTVSVPEAAAASSECPVGYSCGWGNKNFVRNSTSTCQGWVYFQYSLSSFGCMDNQIESIINKGTSCNARWYKNANYGGESILFYRNHQLQDMTTWNNTVSSGKFVC